MIKNQNFFYKLDGSLKRINLDEILFLQVDDNYVRFFALEESHLVRISLDAALNQVPPFQFAKISRSLAVSVNHVDIIKKESLTLTGVDDLELPISKTYSAEFMALIRIIDASSSADTMDPGSIDREST